MKKKIFSLLLAILTSVGTLFAESGQCGDLLYWNLSDGVLTITGYQGVVFGDGKIWDAMDATKYGSNYAAPWYNYRSSIYSIIVSEGVTYIGNCAFLGCSNARTINLPTSVTSIGHSAFKGCSSLTSITISDGVGSIKYGTFAGCSSLSSIIIPNSVTEIEDGLITGKVITNAGAFSDCTSLTSIILPANITSIGVGAFYRCSNLVSIDIPNSVTHLGDYIFYGCSNLSSVTIGHSVSSIGVHAFASSGITSIAIPNSITTISEHAFELCKDLTTVSIGNNVTIIGKESFTGCSSLTSLTIPASVETICESAFNSCSNLRNVHFSEGLKLIKSGGFMNCSSLRSVILPNSLDSLGWQCFNLCSPMDTILIGENLKGKNPSFPSAKVVIWNAKNADIEGIPCGHLTIGENVEALPRSVYYNMIPDTIVCYPTYPPAIYPMENVGTANAKANTILILTDTTYISIPCGMLNNYLATTGWGNYRKKMHERIESGCTPTIRTYYTVTFKDWNGIVLKTEQVEEGQSATAPANPTREGYTFTGWDKDFSNVQSDIIVTAQYTPNTPSTTYYTVTFKDWDGTVLKTEKVEEGQSATAPANPTRDGYTFTGWDKDFSNVQSNLTVTAQYTQNTPSITYYTVTFKDWNGTVLKTEQVEEGHSATAPANPTRDGYTFTGWDVDFSNVQYDMIVTALYSQNPSETPSFTGFESTNAKPLSTQIYAENLIKNKVNVTLVETDVTNHKYSINLTAGGTGSFTMGGVTFSYTNSEAGKTAYKTYAQYIQPNGADREISIPTKTGDQVKVILVEACAGILVNGASTNLNAGDNVLTAQSGAIVLKNTSAKPKISAILPLASAPSITYYSVTFKDWDGTVLKTQQVAEGQSATAPANPTREGYTFTGWDKDFSNVQSDLIVTAQYQKNEIPTNVITVRLKASSASGWSKVNLYYWADGIDSPVWPGTKLSKDAQGWYSYTFPAVVTSVNIIWNDGNNQTADITNVTESTCYKLNSTSGKSITVSVISCEEDIVAVTGVSLNKKTLQINKGGNYTLTATVLPANATNKAVTWTSSNTSVATISNDGKITAKTAGVSTISCETKDGHFKAECYIVVTDASQGCDYSFEPTAATTIQFEATDLSYSAFEGGTFVILEDASHVLYLMYYGSLANGALPVGNHPVSSIEQNGNIIYSIGGDDANDYGSFMATNFTANGYSAAYYIIAGNVSVEANNSITAKLISVNGSDIIATYRGTQDIEVVSIKDSATKILHNGQIYILRGDRTYTLTGQELR